MPYWERKFLKREKLEGNKQLRVPYMVSAMLTCYTCIYVGLICLTLTIT